MKPLAQKRWFRIIPVVFITYSLAYLDRANFGFAVAGGMADDLNITPNTSTLLSSLFFLGYFFFQIPGAHYAATRTAKKLIFISLILWGGLAAATGMVNDTTTLIIIRFMLGVVESAVMPAMLILLSQWFTKEERSRANTFLILGNPVTVLWMSVLSGYLIDSMGWRWMFILQGAPGIVWAFIWWRMIDERPMAATWLTDEEKMEVEERLKAEQAGIKPVKNYAEAFKSKKVILLCLQYLLWSVGVYGFVMWLPSIIKAAPNMNMVNTGWLASVPYLFAVIGMLSASYFSDKSGNRKIFVWPFLLIAAICLYGAVWLGPDQFWFAYALLVAAGAALYTPYGPFFAAIAELLPKNVAGGAIGLINSLGALGSFAGSYLVGYLNTETGNFNASYTLMSVALVLATVITIIVIPGPVRALAKPAEIRTFDH
ncbi:Putative tartrate transporter [Dyadobacter sp. CECT 9623]|uniref:Tartrate transporter n=1 Tax=Dyadobacter linearis TaxID=2823330 RepID=A0ABM8UJA0_9BACT|nr:MFS transporter [Dyadobacter sp. CECT 9623]CAG5067300.1 Putative tartrate transporter [Dyadobacter sp. CECT 9623]